MSLDQLSPLCLRYEIGAFMNQLCVRKSCKYMQLVYAPPVADL